MHSFAMHFFLTAISKQNHQCICQKHILQRSLSSCHSFFRQHACVIHWVLPISFRIYSLTTLALKYTWNSIISGLIFKYNFIVQWLLTRPKEKWSMRQNNSIKSILWNRFFYVTIFITLFFTFTFSLSLSFVSLSFIASFYVHSVLLYISSSLICNNYLVVKKDQ